MRLTLHVGLPKTATTYIQHALSAAKGELARQGVVFPSDSLSHHDLPKLVELVAAGRQKYQARADELMAAFAREMEISGQDHLLISSEYLIETSAPAIARLEKMLQQHFPKISNLVVLCYVREPIAYSTSFCQQVVKSAHQSLAQFYARPWPLDLSECLSRYVDQFGRDAVQVRKFHPDSLKNGDILDDFLDALGVDEQSIQSRPSTLNSALSSQAVQIADALCEIRPVAERRRRYRRAYRRVLESIKGDRFVLPEEVQGRVEEASREDLAMLKREFGVELQVVRQAVKGGDELPEQTARSLARLIVELVEGRSV